MGCGIIKNVEQLLALLEILLNFCLLFYDYRARLKIAFRQLFVPLCGKLGSDEGGVVGYAD